jgi:dTDP-glucose 4,6-dehydratase
MADRLLAGGSEVLCLDNLSTGRRGNITHLQSDPRFAFQEQDVSRTLAVSGPIDAVLHFASPASPPDYLARPIDTLDVGTAGTRNALELAAEKGAVFLLASTSEVYGDPLVHPQAESYWGNVNPVGPRSVYDEAKRAAEAYVMAYRRARGLDTRIVRIFNTYGPRMRRDDGRAVPQFITQALAGDPLTVHGDGSQTRSLCYVDDLVEGIARLLASEYSDPMNLGNPHELTIGELAVLIRELCGSASPIEHHALPVDDPRQRCPDIAKAKDVLGWEPSIELREGLRRTITWWREHTEAEVGAEAASSHREPQLR